MTNENRNSNRYTENYASLSRCLLLQNYCLLNLEVRGKVVVEKDASNLRPISGRVESSRKKSVILRGLNRPLNFFISLRVNLAARTLDVRLSGKVTKRTRVCDPLYSFTCFLRCPLCWTIHR